MGSGPRRYFEGLLLLLLATGFATLASTGRLGGMVTAVAAAAYLVRGIWFWRGRAPRLPGWWWVLALVLYTPVFAWDGMVLSHGFFQASLHFVVLAGAARLFSPLNRRDEVTLSVLAFLEVLTAALLTISGVFFLLFLLFLALLVAALVAQEMRDAEAAASPGSTAAGAGAAPQLRRAQLLRFSLLLSLGIAACGTAIFFLLPRTSLGAWAGRPGGTGLTGFSDEVRLGAIAQLQRDDAPVMHVRLLQSDLDAQAFQHIPWRGRGLTEFDGQRWYSSDVPALFGTQGGSLVVAGADGADAASMVRYQVTLEPMNTPVLFFPSRLLRASTRFPVLAWDRATATLASPGGDFGGTAYEGVSDLAQPSPQALRNTAAARGYGFSAYLQLPAELDPRSPALARSSVAHAGADDDDRMQALSDYLQARYQYSLEDLPQGEHPLAAFLFDQQAGDCEYFASALAVMARTLEIPTRVVNGFAGGTYNPLTGEFVVHGSDAHSWVEAYFPTREVARRYPFRGSRGAWIGFDATPPGAAPAAAAWPGAGMVLDALSSLWQEWIVNYDWMRQARLAGALQSGVGAGAGALWDSASAASAALWTSA
ncbi:MAG: transglutaminaseTgpA domain-containing protein, partial [Terriglobales bacterium]